MIDKYARCASLIDATCTTGKKEEPEQGSGCRLPGDAVQHCTRCEYYHFKSSNSLHPSTMKPFSSLLLAALVLISSSSAADIGKYFTRSPQSIVAPPGDRVNFQCETNIPAEQVKWKMNEKFLHPGNDSDIRITGNFLSVKLSKNRERYMQQVGDYQCVVEWGAEALTSVPAQLSIAKLDGFKAHENRTLSIVEGNSAVIFCDPPYSNPPPIIQFYKDNVPLETETGNPSLTDSGVLYIENVTMASSGNYWCSVTNHITSDTVPSTWSTRLIVQRTNSASRKAPEFLLKPKSYEIVPKDGNITLECVATGNPPPITNFRKLRASTLPNSVQSSRGNLHLLNAGPSQEGEYICEAHNGIGGSVTTLTAVVLNSMPVITKEPENLVVEEGGTAVMHCATEGLPKPRVYWVFNGHSVNDDGNIQLTDNGLKISTVEKKHAGLFQCFATNPMGTVTSPAELKVLPKMITAMASDSSDVMTSASRPTVAPARHHHNENHHHKKKYGKNGRHNKKGRKHKGQDMIPPSKPSMNRVSDESVMVRWSVPENSGYPIQFFKIQYKEVSKKNSRWMTIDDDIPPHIHSYEVRDLRVGYAYKFRIAAVYSNNDNKVGPNSEKLVLQRENTMRRPVFVPVVTTAAPHNSTAIKLQWKYMRGEGGGVDGYFIYYREATTVNDYAKVTVVGSDSEVHYISHLKPGTAYDIKIQAFNRAGASNFSSIITAKTLGIATSENSEEDGKRKKPTEIIIPEEEPVASNEGLYLLLGCLFAGFWILLCVACALCYKCKQKRAEEDAKYTCDIPVNMEAKTLSNGSGSVLNNHGLNGYLHGIAAHVDEKETSFMERHHNNNRPISPSAPTIEEIASFKSAVSLTLERQNHGVNHFIPSTHAATAAPTIISTATAARKEATNNDTNSNSLSRNNSLQRKKHRDIIQNSNSNSLRRGPYISCSSEELDADVNSDSKSGKIFPKEHYKVSRKHNRKRSSLVEG